MSIIALNFVLIVPFVYYVVSNHNNIKLFHPLFMPFLLFLIYYIYPSTALAFKGEEVEFGYHIFLYTIGICFYIFGVWFSYSKRNAAIFKPIIYIPIRLLLFAISGMLLLVVYGYLSGVLPAFFRGENIELLRRKSEIGLGFLKDPAYYIAVFSILMLISQKINKVKPRIFNYYVWPETLLLLSVIAVIFFSIGHKKLALLPLIIFLGMINKVKKYGLGFVFFGVLFLVFLVGLLNIIRGDSDKEFVRHSAAVFKIYEANYKPIVAKVYEGEMEKAYGAEYYPGIVALVPRFLWKEKPISYDYKLKESLNRKFEGGGLPPTVFGSLYLNFGIIGLVLGMFSIGFLYSITYKLYITNDIRYSPFLLYLMFIIMNPSQLLHYLSIFFAFVTLLYVISRRKMVAIKPPSC